MCHFRVDCIERSIRLEVLLQAGRVARRDPKEVAGPLWDRGMSGRVPHKNWISAARPKRDRASFFYGDYRLWTGRSRMVAVGGCRSGVGISGDCSGSRCVRCMARLGIDGQRILGLGSCLASSFIYRSGTRTHVQAAERGLTSAPSPLG
jgi:hypothetical protein